MGNTIISKKTLKFLKDIQKNNNREWYNKNKDYYKEAHDNFKAFVADVEIELNKTDEIEKVKHFRIYRDVRFSKDKTPYNIHFSSSFTRAGVHRRGGYYLRISAEGNFILGGFFNPEPKDMKLIRDQISADPKPLRKILKSKKFASTFGTLHGEQVKSAPRGYSKEDPAIDLLRYKQLLAHREISNQIVTSDKFKKEVVNTFKAMRPFFDYMSDILTHDLNGLPLYR